MKISRIKLCSSQVARPASVPQRLRLLRQVELDLAGGADVAKACRSAGISDATYDTWRKKFGGMARSQLSELKALEKENHRLKKIVANLELDKLILKESLDFLKPKI